MPANLCNIYQFADDNVTANTTVKSNTHSFKTCCENLWIVVYKKSATVTCMPVRNCTTIYRRVTLLRKLPTELRRFSIKQLLLFLASNSHSHILHINNIETPTAINDIIAPEEYQTLWWETREGLFWIPGIPRQITRLFLISNFRPVLSVVCFLLGDSPASQFYMPTFRNTLSHLHTHPPMKLERTECSETSAYKIQTRGNHPEESIQIRYK